MTLAAKSDNSGLAIPAVDLFAGAGGLGLGASWAGCEILLSVDSDPFSCETLRLNEGSRSGTVCEKDVSELSGSDLRDLAGVGFKDGFIVVGGPPCQGFSKAAFWTESGDDARYRRARARGQVAERPAVPTSPPKEDARRSLVQEYARLIVESRPDGFVFENVLSILAPRHRDIIDGFLATVQKAGYRTTVVKANAVEFGVPQRRQRVFVLGGRGVVIDPPVPTHSLPDKPTGDLLPCVAAGDVLVGLDTPEFFEPEEVIAGKWAHHLAEVPPGSNYRFHTAWAGHPDPTFEVETRFWNFLLKLSPELPSWTITANPGPWTGPFHWSTRRLRTIEMAALQSFPRDYTFAGNRRDRVRQIGNAVPPLLGEVMTRQVVQAVGSR